MQDKNEVIGSLKEHAKNIRKNSLLMANRCGTNAHLGGGLSLVEALTVLYGAVMNSKDLPYDEKDKFILSKGHGVLGFYAALAEFGIIDKELLDTFLQDGSDLIAHPVMNTDLGIEASSGSLGQGISMAIGLALSAKRKGYSYQTYVLCGNGESNEGSVWEACMSAVNYELDNFTLFLDNNHMQSDGTSESVMNISDKYSGMLDALGFQVIEIDGNDIEQVYDAFLIPHQKGKPKAIIGNTIKGKGVSYMENNNDWHHNRLTNEQLESALAEIGWHND
ncbi:transketolase [Butyrivibrio proteoclasticus]|uniref:transketolase n=1 Tax=Butyrivibrio proteoclasticus TaxID=43305 RepID=UPI00047BF8C3|nr:transketolase [Butyrivibrio proteoclasticus]